MRATVASGRKIAVVSNNSAQSVRAFFAERPVPEFADGAIVGRRFGRPELMKPHPAPIVKTIRLINVSPGEAVLIGDSLTDLIAARAAGVACIGFADKPGKDTLLADADVVIDDMQVLAVQLAEVSARNGAR
jgi:beta-phosphoglucomutase-like phosphatase (HAD superfamily)